MWILVLSVCSIIVMSTTMMLCLCWRKKTQKNDLMGLDGLVTQKNPDENVNHLPSAIAHQSVPDGMLSATSDTVNDANKRPVTVNNPRRSLPDIPSEGGVRNDGDMVTYEPNGDNSSDLYATVEPYQNSSAKLPALPNGLDSHPIISQRSSVNQSPYARVKEHPYDKLRGKTEHPYARVQPSSSQEQDENSSGEATPRTVALRNEALLGEPAASSRSRRSSVQSGISSDIPAASAVAGGIAANQELPYMTPPITQPNFSGDSQDSSKGYTSISVREPLANIRAQTKALNKGQNDLDPHYSTVSDDSDDVYTTIPDPNNPIYTSGSETYAQIQPPQLTVAVEINPDIHLESQHAQNESTANRKFEPAPQPPSVDSLKHVTHTHSRQASSSSSVGNLGSPKPEKRQANSPLPPPPSSTAPHVDLLTVDRPSTSRNLDDMYAKVQKNKKKTERDVQDEVLQQPERNLDVKLEYDCFGIPNSNQHNYETLRKSPRKCSDPGYEKLKPRDEEGISEPGYDTINGPDSILSSDPGYEVLKLRSLAPSEVDPNYEELRHRTSSASDSTAGYQTITQLLNGQPCNNITDNNGYSLVNKQSKYNSSTEEVKSKNSSSYESDIRDPSTDEPNYESMPSESLSEHNYAVLKSNGSESDPNYEFVNHGDPNYESVKYLDASSLEEEPPYERLQDEDSSKTDSNASTAVATTGEESKCDSIDPGYETIKSEKSNKNNSNGQVDNDYDGIVQV